MLAYIIALKLSYKKDNMSVNEAVRTLGYDGLARLVEDETADSLSGLINISKLLSLRTKILDNLDKAEEIIHLSKAHNIRVVSILDDDYPSNLKLLLNCPPILYVKGNINRSYEKALGCVGTRSPSRYGIRSIESLVPEWVREGFTIVSGLAEGSDSFSHKACIENGGTTIAVVAHGLDFIYPKNNENLAQDILNQGGLIVSEYPIGEQPKKYSFIHRNEWIVGLSKALIVFEAKIKSGTMSSVKFASRQGKPIYCPVPVYPEIPEVEGINELLQAGTALGIRNRHEYCKVISELGYALSASASQDQERYWAYTDMKQHFSNIKFYRDNNKPKRKILMNIDENLYQAVERLAQHHGLTVQAMFDSIRLAIPMDKAKGVHSCEPHNSID